ncbi:phage tail length tape measure family protein [Bradyrhizobium sp. INPA03-11B]|uniref:phage tail length tape measure family protein n=1 Tax=Bradyrhizobium sp. INPA03-11B TaxID=418598 RepID=UPI00338F6560
MTDTIDKIVIQSETQGVEQSTSEIQGLSKAMDGVTVASANVERSTGSIDSKFSSLERRFSTTAGQLSQFQKVQQQVNTAVAQNPQLQDRANAVLAAAEIRYGAVSQSLQKQRTAMEQVAAVQKTVNANTGILGDVNSAARAADVTAYGKALDDLRAKYNPLFAAGQQYKATLTEINQAVKVGALTEAEGAIARAATKSSFVDEVAALKNAKTAVDDVAHSHAGLSTQGMAAMHAVRSTVEQLALGIPPTQALAGQMNHLTYAATGEGGLTGAFKEAAGVFAGLISPTALLVGGIAALGAGALYLGNSWSEANGQVTRALTGIGAATGTTAADINNFAKTNSSATGLSISDARNAAIEFTKTGNIAVQSLHGVGEAIHGYAVLTGTDAATATKTLAGALSGDLVKGAEEINKTYMSLSASTLDYIGVLQNQGERTKATQIIIDSMKPANERAAESVGVLTKAWQALSGAMAYIKTGPAPATPQDQLAALQAQRAAIASSPSLVGANTGGFGLLNTNALAGGKSQQLAELDKQIADLQKKIDQFNATHATTELNKLSTEARTVVQAIVPQDEQIRILNDDLQKLQAAKDKGIDVAGSDAASVAIKNQIASLQDAKDQAVNYNQRVADISAKWGDVGQSAALSLEKAQNQLPVLQAVGGAAKMAAQYTADYKNYLDQGYDKTEATALAASHLAASQAQATSGAQEQLASLRDAYAVATARTVQEQIAAQSRATYNQLLRDGVDAETAEAVATQQAADARARIYEQMQKTVQASRDQVALLQAQGTSDEATLRSQIAYRNAIDAGADSTQAAIIAQNTLTASALQSAKAAQQYAEQMENAQRAAHDAQYADITPGGDNSFGFFQTKEGITGASVETIPYQLKKQLQDASVAPPGVADRANTALANGLGVNSTLAAIQKLTAGTVTNNPAGQLEAIYQMQPGQLGLSKSTTINDSDIISQVQQLYDIKNAQTTDTAVKNANLQEELAWLNSRPESIARDQAIAQLTQAIQQNSSATSANTASLNPLYNGRGALQIGYYKAASGLDVVAQGPTSGDQIPFHAMVNGGERITVTPAGQSASSTDNRRTIVQNITLPPAPTSSARRVQRQWAQGFGQAAAALG